MHACYYSLPAFSFQPLATSTKQTSYRFSLYTMRRTATKVPANQCHRKWIMLYTCLPFLCCCSLWIELANGLVPSLFSRTVARRKDLLFSLVTRRAAVTTIVLVDDCFRKRMSIIVQLLIDKDWFFFFIFLIIILSIILFLNNCCDCSTSGYQRKKRILSSSHCS